AGGACAGCAGRSRQAVVPGHALRARRLVWGWLQPRWSPPFRSCRHVRIDDVNTSMMFSWRILLCTEMSLFATSLVAIANTSQLLSQELMVSGLTQAPSLP